MSRAQPAEGQAFLDRLRALPKTKGTSILPALEPSLKDESDLRKLFAQDKSNPRLTSPHVGLVDVFGDGTEDLIKIKERVFDSDEEKKGEYVMPLKEKVRLKDGEDATCGSLDEFKRLWGVFSEGSLSQLIDWNNVIAAGGSVLAALLPLPAWTRESRRNTRKYFHSVGFPTSDIDLFIYGLNEKEAEAKANQIYEAVRDSVPWETTCVRTKHAVSIISQYPYRPVQLVLRLYSSPAEVLAGFDVDACAVAFDGERVWAAPRAVAALMTQCNRSDVNRRSPSYEVRLAKYAERGFEVHVPNLKRADIDPTIYERSIARIKGLARLLVLESMSTPDERIEFLNNRRQRRGRPEPKSASRYGGMSRRRRRAQKGDLKAAKGLADLDLGASGYETAVVQHIPYGPGWDARRIETLVYKQDLGLNSTFNPKNKDKVLHRHPAFFGTMAECMEDCCQFCPEPRDDEEKALQEEDDKTFIRGRISFMVEDPGRQSISGSFQPIDVGEWSEQAYIGDVEKLFNAIAEGDKASVVALISGGAADLQKRDHVGRTPLQLAIIAEQMEIAELLVDEGARITARLVDGRTAFHLAAEAGFGGLLKKMLEASERNKREAEEKQKRKEEEEERRRAEEGKASKNDDDKEEDGVDPDDEDEEQGSSEDDWDSDGEVSNKKKKATKTDDPDEGPNAAPPDAEMPDEENLDEPDVIDINLPDWDLDFSPIHFAVVAGSSVAVDVLVEAGADLRRGARGQGHGRNWSTSMFPLYPLTCTILARGDPEVGCQLAIQLLKAGAISTQADAEGFTAFHRAVLANKIDLVKTFVKHDPKAKAAINFIAFPSRRKFLHPLVSPIMNNNRAMVGLLLMYGAKINLTQDDFLAAVNANPNKGNSWQTQQPDAWRRDMYQALESSIGGRNDIYTLLVALGANVSVATCDKWQYGSYQEEYNLSLVDFAQWAHKKLAEINPDPEKKQDLVIYKLVETNDSKTGNASSFSAIYRRLAEAYVQNPPKRGTASWGEERRLKYLKEFPGIKGYYDELARFLESKGAMSMQDIEAKEAAENPDKPAEQGRNRRVFRQATQAQPNESIFGIGTAPSFELMSANSWVHLAVQQSQVQDYIELFEACWKGDNKKIKEVTLGSARHASGRNKLQIAVRVKYLAQAPAGHVASNGLNPLAVAILNRKWDTARLVYSIAAVQHQNSTEVTAEKFSLAGATLGEDDGEDEDADDEDDEDEDQEFDDSASIGDVADHQAVRTEAGPDQLLLERLTFDFLRPILKEGVDYPSDGTLLDKSIVEDDLATFTKLLELSTFDAGAALRQVLYYDRPGFLDELIRRAGVGIHIESLEEESKEGDDAEADNTLKRSQPRFYQGLSIHGQKKANLARMNDPDRQVNNTDPTPLLHSACASGAEKVITYLSQLERVRSSYDFYIDTHPDSHAADVLGSVNLEKRLPGLLGVTTRSSKGESSVNALFHTLQRCPQEKQVGMIKHLISSFPQQAKEYLHGRDGDSKMTSLLAACAWRAGPECVDYLWNSGVDPLVRDSNGQNILHLLFNDPDWNKLELKLVQTIGKLSGANELTAMLSQTTYIERNTPIMHAVENGAIAYITFLLSNAREQLKPSLLIRDAEGFLPLHVAVAKGYAGIVALLAQAEPLALFVENGVGDLPLETARRLDLLNRNCATFPGQNVPALNLTFPNVGSGDFRLENWAAEFTPPLAIPDEKDLDDLKSVVADVGPDVRDKNVTRELVEFCERSEEVLARYRKAKEMASDKTEEDKSGVPDLSDVTKTLRVLEEFIAKHEGKGGDLKGGRKLVHLLDAQRAVSFALPTKDEGVNDESGGANGEKI